MNKMLNVPMDGYESRLSCLFPMKQRLIYCRDQWQVILEQNATNTVAEKYFIDFLNGELKS